jgi:hypothetical protein
MSKAEIIEKVLPTDIKERASSVIVNESGVITILKDRGILNQEDTITITYTFPIDAAIEFFTQINRLKNIAGKPLL